eukprot:7008185-Pyramimonas_sp.AAC.2
MTLEGALSRPNKLSLSQTERAEAHAQFEREREMGKGLIKGLMAVWSPTNLNLRHPPRGGREAGELEIAETFVIPRKLALALEHNDVHRGL